MKSSVSLVNSLSCAPDLQRRFGGIIRLYGEPGYHRFRQAHIGIIGIGGVGSWVVEALARSAIGTLTLIDLDTITESNVNRQIHALDGAFGRAKVDAMATRIRDINPKCEVIVIEDFLSLDNLQPMLGRGYDYVIDCMDDYRVKAAMVAYCKQQNIKLITLGGAGGQTNPTRIRIADLSDSTQDRLLARTRKQLRQHYDFSRDLERNFDIPCVYSDEKPIFPDGNGGLCREKPQGAAGLNCSGGVGSVMTVTASFGLVAVSYVLGQLNR